MMRALLVRLGNLFRARQLDRDLDAEIDALLQMHVDENLRRGLTRDEARRQALLTIGGIDALRETHRDHRGIPMLETVVNDLQYAVRVLRRNPAFTFVAVASLAAGIGANTAMFSVFNALLLRSLPIPHPERVFLVRHQSALPSAQRFSYPRFEEFRGAVPDRNGIAAMSRVGRFRTIVDATRTGQEPEATNVQLVSGEYFSVLGLHAAVGRLLTHEDNRTLGGHPVAVISHAFWRGRLAGAPDAVGRELRLAGSPFTIVGVAPERFSGVWLESPVDIWIPVAMQADVRYAQNFSASDSDTDKPWMAQPGIRWLDVIVRADRADGPEAVALSTLFRQIVMSEAQEIADAERRRLFFDQRLFLESFRSGSSGLRQRFQTPLFALMAMVAVLLLVACANTANLLLARAATRRREIAVRLSIGASRGRVVRQLLTESVLLGLLAGALGVAVAPIASEFLVRMTLGVDTGPLPFSVGIDGRVLAFTAALSVLTSVLFGMVPAWRTTDMMLADALKTGRRGLHAGARLNLGKALVVAQVALSLLLVVGAGLFLRTFRNLADLDLGLARDHVVSVGISPGAGNYKAEELWPILQRLIARAEALPGVRSATVAMCGLLTGCRANVDGIAITGYQSRPDEQMLIQENRVGPRYFATVGMRLVDGRLFDDRDLGRRVAIVNEAMARRYFNNRSPLGQQFGYDTPSIDIVGVVADARVNNVREAAVPMAFYPLDPARPPIGTLDVRTSGDPHALIDQLRRVVREVEPNLPISRVTTLTDQAATTIRQERLVATLTLVLGGLALGLAGLGLYGLMAYGVKQRTAELGVRLALGAPPPRVLWMVFRESLALVGAGLLIGVPVALSAAQFAGGLLFDVKPTDPATLIVATLTLTIVAAWASYFPAWRASRVDPLIALRCE